MLHRSDRPRRAAFVAAVVVSMAGLLEAAPSGAAEPNPAQASPRGLVDSAPFVQFASDESDLVEVDLKPSVLRALTKAAASKDDGEARALARVSSVRAVVVGLAPKRVDAAAKLIESTAAELRSKGWEELARVRDRSARIRVLVLCDKEQFAGFTVLLIDRKAQKKEGDGEDGPQLVFANIVGHFDLADLGKLSGHLDIPGVANAVGDSKSSASPGSKAGQEKAP